ncbi:helix-turn-helix domain-containing protein [Nostocoides vanveenii]|uniref:HTH cro/C1-type domain-containing protein n=1 Tax=Nostocoides vanveenii TaxID=330835 RepID=A0ABP4WQF1_9MICO
MTDNDPTDIMQIAAVVQQGREAAGLSASELARAAGIQPSTVTRLERGEKCPTAPTLIAIAQALGVPATDLLVSARWVPKDELPSFTPYLRAKYGDLSSEAKTELEASFQRIVTKYGYDPSGPTAGEDEA